MAAGLLSKAFVAAEEERLVADKVAADCGAKLVLFEFLKVRSTSVGEKIVGIQLVVAEKLPACSVQVVRAGFGDGGDKPAAGPAIAGRHRVGQDVELLHGVNGRNHRHAVITHRGVGHVVEEEIVGQVSPAVDGDFV